MDDDSRVAIAGPDAISLRTPVEVHGENLSTVAEFTVSAGERVPFVLTWFPSHHDAPARIDPDQALEDTCSFWREWIGSLHLRRPLERGRDPLADGAEGDDLRADRRHRGGADDLACPS